MQESCYWISNWSGRHTWRTKENDSVSKKWRLGSPRKGGPSALHLWSLGCFLDKSPQNNLGAQVTLLKKKKKKNLPGECRGCPCSPHPGKQKSKDLSGHLKSCEIEHMPQAPQSIESPATPRSRACWLDQHHQGPSHLWGVKSLPKINAS